MPHILQVDCQGSRINKEVADLWQHLQASAPLPKAGQRCHLSSRSFAFCCKLVWYCLFFVLFCFSLGNILGSFPNTVYAVICHSTNFNNKQHWCIYFSFFLFVICQLMICSSLIEMCSSAQPVMLCLFSFDQSRTVVKVKEPFMF